MHIYVFFTFPLVLYYLNIMASTMATVIITPTSIPTKKSMARLLFDGLSFVLFEAFFIVCFSSWVISVHAF